MAAEVTEAVMVDMEMKTRMPKAPVRRCTATGVDLPDDTGRFAFLRLWLGVLNMNSHVGIQGECAN